ncbi:MAG: hypothetical protein JO022_20715 [Acidobacteriaceae bacterium]|nr:hypothetical protein [Acidobacteriaceae bacterium]
MPAVLLLLASCGTKSNQPIGLTGKLEGHSVVLQWNSRAPVIEQAKTGKIRIAGGRSALEKTLTPEQLGQGRLVYSPAYNDVSVSMEVETKNGSTSRETLQVVDSPGAAGEQQAERMKPPPPPARPPDFPLPPRAVRY